MKKYIRKIIGDKCYKLLSDIKTFRKLIEKIWNLLVDKKNIKVILIDVPQYGNLGDQAITLGEIAYIYDNYANYKFHYFNVGEINLNKPLVLRVIEKICNNNDIIFLQGGGHFGDLYIESEIKKRLTIEIFKENKIILFPSTLTFSNTTEGDKEKKISQKIYNQHKDLTLILREERSYKEAKSIFTHANVILMPDIVFYLVGTKFQEQFFYDKRNFDISICFRKDKESFFTLSEKENLIVNIKNKYKLVKIFDTNIECRINSQNREFEVSKLWKKFSESKLIITDRFHGMIFSILTKTPCIVLRSADHKIIESLKWISDYDLITYVDNLEDVEKNIDLILSSPIDEHRYQLFYKFIKSQFYNTNNKNK